MIDPKSLRIGNYSPLFQEIMGAMYEPLHATISKEDAEKAARAIEQRVMPWIEKAYFQNPALEVQNLCGTTSEGKLFTKFCEENGLTTPTESDKTETLTKEEFDKVWKSDRRYDSTQPIIGSN